MSTNTIHLLCYDIPTASRLPNPSGQLREVAVRINLSCWVIRAGDIPYAMLDRLKRAGGRWHAPPFAHEAGEGLTQMIVDSLRKELADALERATEAEEKAIDELDGHTQENIEASGRYHLGKYRQTMWNTVRKLQQALHDVRNVADRFGVADSYFPLADMQTQVETIRFTMEERAKRYAEAGRLCYQSGTHTGEAIKRAVEADRIPAEMVADYLEDMSLDAEATALREAFN